MSLAIVNYPTLSPDDYSWIQSVRAEHDRLYYHVIEPHISLVFPTDMIVESVLLDHARRHAAAHPAFEAVFRCAVLGDLDFQDHAHAFLVPDEGFSKIVHLHDKLYTGPLAPELRLDLPFLPHIGIANTPTPKACKSVVDRLNAMQFVIRARIESFHVIGFDGKQVWTIDRFPLCLDE
jgi:hypothetical protein